MANLFSEMFRFRSARIVLPTGVVVDRIPGDAPNRVFVYPVSNELVIYAPSFMAEDTFLERVTLSLLTLHNPDASVALKNC